MENDDDREWILESKIINQNENACIITDCKLIHEDRFGSLHCLTCCVCVTSCHFLLTSILKLKERDWSRFLQSCIILNRQKSMIGLASLIINHDHKTSDQPVQQIAHVILQ